MVFLTQFSIINYEKFSHDTVNTRKCLVVLYCKYYYNIIEVSYYNRFFPNGIKYALLNFNTISKSVMARKESCSSHRTISRNDCTRYLDDSYLNILNKVEIILEHITVITSQTSYKKISQRMSSKVKDKYEFTLLK